MGASTSRETDTLKPVTLSGLVRHQGLPVKAVTVKLYGTEPAGLADGDSMPGHEEIDSVTTGDSGEFEFLVAPGTYSIEAVPRDDSRLLKEMIDTITVRKISESININLRPGNVLRGTVVTADGDRLKDCNIKAIEANDRCYSVEGKCDERGEFNLVLPRGRFLLASYCSKAADPETGSLAYLATRLTEVTVNRDEQVVLTLPDLFRFQGEVVDVFGQPVTAARVSFRACCDPLESQDLEIVASALTDSRGRFELHLESGRYDLDIDPGPDSEHFGMRETGLRVSSDLLRKYTLEEGYKLKGEVTFDDLALADCLVRIQRLDCEREFIARTDEQGKFLASVPGGEYTLVVFARPDSAERAELAPWTRDLKVDRETFITAKMQKGIAVTGKVTDDSGQSRPGVRVSVFANDPDRRADRELRGNLSGSLAHSITDAEGAYSMFLSRGSYFMVVHDDLDNRQMLAVEEKALNFDISWHGWCRLAFSVRGDDGANVPRCQVEYEPYKSGAAARETVDDSEGESKRKEPLPSGQVLTGEDGSCSLTLPAGVYSFRFNPPEAAAYEGKNIRQLSISHDLSKKVSLKLKQEALK